MIPFARKPRELDATENAGKWTLKHTGGDLARGTDLEAAIRDAAAGDLVLIAGKGHEKYQVIGDKTLPFDDVEVARAALTRRRAGSRVS